MARPRSCGPPLTRTPTPSALLISKGAEINARSGTTAPGRRPYLAESGRNRIEEFIEGRGQGGTVVEVDAPDAKVSDDPNARAEATKRLTEEREVAKRTIAAFPTLQAGSRSTKQWGGLTPLQFAVREGSLETVKTLVDAGADVNQRSEFGWTRAAGCHAKTATTRSACTCSITAPIRTSPTRAAGRRSTSRPTTRNIEGGDYPTRKPDMDHLEYIKRLFAAHANPNLRMRSSTETRTIFTHQWLLEEGATPFLRASQSGDVVLMKLLLEHGADPKITTEAKVTPLMVASGIGWVAGRDVRVVTPADAGSREVAAGSSAPTSTRRIWSTAARP